MATWLVGHTPWILPARARLFNRLDVLPWLQVRSHLNLALQAPSPASLEIETMPYPTAHPDASVFESMSEEYAAVSTSAAHPFTPLSSSETLAALVSKGDFQAAESLRKEMISHHIPIPRDTLYLRAALHAVTARRPKGSAKARMDAFEAWLSLAPDHHEKWQSFHDIRRRLFWSMDHLNLTLVYRFGLVLASKGYCSGGAAKQVVSTLARYAPLSVVERYLREVEDASRDYYLKKDIVLRSDALADAYSLCIRTVALRGNGDAALALISLAHSRGTRLPDFTLSIVAKLTSNQQTIKDQIRTMYPSWTMQDTTHPAKVEFETISAVQSTNDIAALAARLRSLRMSLRSPSPPSPHALNSFLASYKVLGRTHALALLRSLAYRHSPKSASTWAFAEMLHHRSRHTPMHVLLVFSQHFHPIGVPRKTLLSLIRGPQGKLARKEHAHQPCPLTQKLWPSAYHTALVWEAIVWLSPKAEKERLYALLLSLVRQSQRVPTRESGQADLPRVQLSPTTYDMAHFSPFILSWARRDPARAARVLQDMLHLGIAPSTIQWSILARGYAQHDDPRVALRILDRLEDAGASDLLMGVHTNVLRGCVLAGDVQHAREVVRRLVERLGYKAGDRPATDANIALLQVLEDRLEAP
ncbi:hypothetical protein JVU11DRAFT_5831 [Chiua virens]|nr:hypothetical protein JVU11DRAFT_5831 [Chiua virens]